jgi:hypothetical protein
VDPTAVDAFLVAVSHVLCVCTVCVHMCKLLLTFVFLRLFAKDIGRESTLLSLRLESLLGKRLISLVLVVQIAARRRNFPHPPP